MRLDHLIRLISQQWAIQPDVLENWCQILDAKLAGQSVPEEFTRVSNAGSRRDQEEPFTRDGNVAVIPLVGTLVKANTLFSCDATYAELRQAVNAALSAKGIEAIVIDGDTPGGTVAGVQETGDFLARANLKKPVYGWVDDLTASAGYWLLAQTRMIGAHQAADIGSIGVLTVHYDRSGRDQQAGVRRTVLAVGAMKAAGNDAGPLDGEAQAYIMDRLEQTFGLFINAVVRGRPQLTAEAIRAMQSRVYKSAQARELGLIDHVLGRDEYIDLIKRQTRGAVSASTRQGAKAMKLEELKKEHPDLVAQIEAAAREGMVAKSDADAAQAAAATTSRDGLLALHAAVYGEETGKKFAAIVDSGISADQAKALGVSAKVEDLDEQSRAAILAALTGAAPDGLKPAQPGTGGDKGSIDTAGIYAGRRASGTTK